MALTDILFGDAGDVTASNTLMQKLNESIQSSITQNNRSVGTCNSSVEVSLIAPDNCPGGSTISGVDIDTSAHCEATMSSQQATMANSTLQQTASQTLQQTAEAIGQSVSLTPGSTSSSSFADTMSNLATAINNSSTNDCRLDSGAVSITNLSACNMSDISLVSKATAESMASCANTSSVTQQVAHVATQSAKQTSTAKQEGLGTILLIGLLGFLYYGFKKTKGDGSGSPWSIVVLILFIAGVVAVVYFFFFEPNASFNQDTGEVVEGTSSLHTTTTVKLDELRNSCSDCGRHNDNRGACIQDVADGRTMCDMDRNLMENVKCVAKEGHEDDEETCNGKINEHFVADKLGPFQPQKWDARGEHLIDDTSRNPGEPISAPNDMHRERLYGELEDICKKNKTGCTYSHASAGCKYVPGTVIEQHALIMGGDDTYGSLDDDLYGDDRNMHKNKLCKIFKTQDDCEKDGTFTDYHDDDITKCSWTNATCRNDNVEAGEMTNAQCGARVSEPDHGIYRVTNFKTGYKGRAADSPTSHANLEEAKHYCEVQEEAPEDNCTLVREVGECHCTGPDCDKTCSYGICSPNKNLESLNKCLTEGGHCETREGEARPQFTNFYTCTKDGSCKAADGAEVAEHKDPITCLKADTTNNWQQANTWKGSRNTWSFISKDKCLANKCGWISELANDDDTPKYPGNVQNNATAFGISPCTGQQEHCMGPGATYTYKYHYDKLCKWSQDNINSEIYCK